MNLKQNESHPHVKPPPTKLLGALFRLYDNFAHFISLGPPSNLGRVVLICPISFQMNICIQTYLYLFETPFLYKNPTMTQPHLGLCKSTGIYNGEGPPYVEYIDLTGMEFGIRK